MVDNDLWIHDLASGATLHGVAQSSPVLIRWRRDGLRLAVGELALTATRPEVCTYDAGLAGENEGRSCRAGGVRSGFAYRPDGRPWMSIEGGSANAGRTVLCTLRLEGEPSGCADPFRVADPAFSLDAGRVSRDRALRRGERRARPAPDRRPRGRSAGVLARRAPGRVRARTLLG